MSCPHLHSASGNLLCSSIRQCEPGCFQKVRGCRCVWEAKDTFSSVLRNVAQESCLLTLCPRRHKFPLAQQIFPTKHELGGIHTASSAGEAHGRSLQDKRDGHKSAGPQQGTRLAQELHYFSWLLDKGLFPLMQGPSSLIEIQNPENFRNYSSLNEAAYRKGLDKSLS